VVAGTLIPDSSTGFEVIVPGRQNRVKTQYPVFRSAYLFGKPFPPSYQLEEAVFPQMRKMLRDELMQRLTVQQRPPSSCPQIRYSFHIKHPGMCVTAPCETLFMTCQVLPVFAVAA